MKKSWYTCVKPNLRPKNHPTHLEGSLFPPNDEGIGGQALLSHKSQAGTKGIGAGWATLDRRPRLGLDPGGFTLATSSRGQCSAWHMVGLTFDRRPQRARWKTQPLANSTDQQKLQPVVFLLRPHCVPTIQPSSLFPCMAGLTLLDTAGVSTGYGGPMAEGSGSLPAMGRLWEHPAYAGLWWPIEYTYCHPAPYSVTKVEASNSLQPHGL